MKTLLLICLTFSITHKLQGEVWRAKKEWSTKWEKKYSSWMKSSRVHTQIFTSKKSRYYGINADCADAAYALRAIFALENSLPFKVLNPSNYSSGKKYLSNETDKFDSAGSSNKRLVAMINYLGSQVGTEHLAIHDTYPVSIASINAGTIFAYKVKGDDGNYARHAYNIKNVNSFGEFDLLYSSQAIAKANLNMVYKKSRLFTFPPLIHHWGFKRFKWPRLHHVKNSSLPSSFHSSNEQYTLAKKMNARSFFRHVSSSLKTGKDSAEGLLGRKFNTVCSEARERIAYVNQGYSHHIKTGQKCMSYSDYDAYSTPLRDKTLRYYFLDLKDAVSEVIESGKQNQVNHSLMQMAKAIIYGYSKFSSSDYKLKKYCSIKYSSNRKIHLAELYKRVMAGRISSHPNDSLGARWGEPGANYTKCKKWY
ncbi:hypothetical protein N9O57_00260 [bacterium]|nr:hypothetical protein [bacterium]